MSIRVRWNNLSNAIVELPRPVWSTSMGWMGRVAEYLRQVFRQSDKRSEPSFANQPYQSSQSSTSTSARDCDCTKRSGCDIYYPARDEDGNETIVNIKSAKCDCGNTEYTISAVRTEGQGAGARIRVGNELRANKCSNKASRATISNNDGI